MNEHANHSTERLTTLSLGVLDQSEIGEAHAQVESCQECRAIFDELTAMTEVLGDLPPEAFLDGPPDDGDLLLQRTLRQVRAESARRTMTRRLTSVAAVAIGIAVAIGGGVAIGHSGTTTPAVALPAHPAPGTMVISGTDGASRITAQVTPQHGWVRVHAAVVGIPAGQRCDLVVVAKDGSSQVAGSWLVSSALQRNGVTLDGSALVDPSDVAAVQVRNQAGHTFVSARE